MAGETRPGTERSTSAKHPHSIARDEHGKPHSPAAVSRSRAARMLPNCYVCGARGADTTLRSRPHASEPFFPFLQYHDASPGTVFRPDGTVDCCQVCQAFLKQQWLAYESTNTPIVKRLYWLKRSDGIGGGHSNKPDPQMQVSPQVREEMYKLNIRDSHYSDTAVPTGVPLGSDNSKQDNGFSVPAETADHKRRISFDSVDVDIPAVTVCYGCGATTSKQSTRVVHTSHWSKSEAPYFPCILGHPAPSGAKPVDNLGRVLMCELCTLFLLRQWHSFERDSVSLHQRKYHLRSETDPNQDSMSGAPNHIVCFLCGKAVNLSDTHLIRARRYNSSEPYYPFLDKHSAPLGSAPLSKEGLAQVCLPCSKDLYEQWNAHELTHTPHDKRVYRIHKAKKQSRPHTSAEPGLHKQAEKRHKVHICYLCAQTVPIEHVKAVDTLAPDKSNSHIMYFPFFTNIKKPSQAKPIDADGRALICSNCYLELEQQWKVYQAEGIPHSERRYVGKYKQSSPIDTHSFTKGVCYLCGAHSDSNGLYKVHSYPRRTTTNIDEATPFFPFLASRNPALSAAPIDADGTVLSCTFCYFNLIAQWQDFEDSKAFADSNRWLRHYFVHEFACFVCGHLTSRDDVRTLSTKEYPSLLGIERPRGAVVLENGNIIFTCSTCELSLIRQRRTYEHMQIPEEQRSYKVGTASSSRREVPISNNRERKPGEGRNESVIVIDSDSDGEREHVSLHHHGNPDSVQSSLSPKSGSSSNSRPASEGAPSHGAKPPPLTVVTSSSSKATRTTATVNPLNQSASTVTVTSANSTNHAMAATRTSSFAAALRKLAKHANDNGPEEHSPRVSPVSMNRSTASTPSTKNFHFGPSPLVVPTSTPPVVTIAPTHTNNSSLMSEQRRLSQELDRHGHHNSSEPHNSSRQPSESSSAPNSIWRSKGSPGAGPRRPVPQHLKPEESNPVRGFQPYRSGETEMTPRPPAPAPPPPPPPPSHLTYDPAMMAAALSPYPFHQAFMGPPHMPYHSFRPEDSYDRYSSYPGLRPPPFIPFSSPPSHLFPHPAINPLAFSGMRYSGDLAAMQLSHLSPGVSFGGLVSPSAQHEREKLLLDQQRDRERRAEEAKQEAAQKEKQQQQQRETERENHDRALLSRSHEDKRCSPRDGSHLRHSSSHHHNHHHHHHHHQQLAHSQHHLGTPRVPSSTSASTPSSSGHRDPEQSPLPLLKKADVEDRWQSKHLKDGSSGDAQYRHVRNSQATSHENHVSHTSEKERKSSLHHERELLLQQDRRIAERHEKERNLLREQRNQARGEHHHSGRPPPLVSPVRPTREEMYRHKLFNNHRPSGQDTVIPPQYDYERLNNVDRILLNDKSSVSASGTTAATTTSAAEKAWYEQQRTMMASRVQSPHGSTAREFDHEARVVVTNSHGPQPPGVATHSKSSHLSQYDYDRPHAEFNYHWQDLYRLSQQVRDHSGVQLNEVGEPVVSKLDLEGRKRTETRANGIYISSESDSDSEEETEVKRQRYRKRMHRIVRKSCMTLDDSEKKTNFFQVMGLVTHGKKEEISEEKRRKRRLWLKEEQPPAKVSRPSSELVSLLPAPASLSQEDFQRELDYPHKCRFLRGLGLDVVGVDKRKEMEKARAAVEAYRIRQAKKKEAAAEGETKGESVSTAGSSETAQTPTTPTNSGTDSKVETSENPQCKTAFGETFPNHLVSSSPGVQAHTQNERTLPSGGSSTPQTRTPDNSLHPVPGKQLSLSDRDIKKEPAAGSERADLARSSSNNNRSGTTADQQGPGGALPFSTAALLSRGGPSVGGAGKPPSQFEGFAQEFHQSVLRTTQEAMAQQRVGSLGSNSSSLVQVDAQRRDRHAFAGLTNSNSESTGSGRSNGTVWSKGQLQWPGVEAVMDSYQRHAKEQELERSVLLDQQGRLRVCNGELNSTAEQLRLKMADMMERKQLLHREQEAYLRDLHHLQKYVYNMRK